MSSTPSVRGLVIGILGAFAAGGAVIASTKLYATSLGGGDAAYGVLFVAVFVGMAIGMGITPRHGEPVVAELEDAKPSTARASWYTRVGRQR